MAWLRSRVASGALALQFLQRPWNWIKTFLPVRVGSSMVEQRPFKALVAGSSPAQPTIPVWLRQFQCPHLSREC